jgi:hypothetical protein
MKVVFNIVVMTESDRGTGKKIFSHCNGLASASADGLNAEVNSRGQMLAAMGRKCTCQTGCCGVSCGPILTLKLCRSTTFRSMLLYV